MNGVFVLLDTIAFTEFEGGVDSSGDRVANDFALARIPDRLSSLVDPSMPVWGGPYGADSPCATDAFDHLEDAAGNLRDDPLQAAQANPPDVPGLVVWYGNADVLGEVWPTKARPGFFSECTESDDGNPVLFRTIGPSFFGDSGAAVNHAYVDQGALRSGQALGHLTLLGGAGTTAPYAQGMAEQAGLSVEVVTVS